MGIVGVVSLVTESTKRFTNYLQRVYNMSRMVILWLEVIFGILGLSLFWYATDWVTTLGLYLILFANNIGHSRKVKEN